MSIRTNSMKAVPSLQRRLATIRAKEKDESINAKLENLKSELNNIKDLFSTVKKNQDELLDTLTLLDTLLRALGTKNFIDIANRILQHPHEKDQTLQSPEEKQDQNKKKMDSLEKRVELMDQALEGICKSIKDSAEKLKPGVCGGGGGASHSRQDSGGGRVNSALHVIVSQIKNKKLVGPVLKRIQVSYDNLTSGVKSDKCTHIIGFMYLD